MNLKIDFDSSLKDFEANCQAADAALDDKSNNIVPIIYSGLQLTSCLSFDFDIDLYCELHSTCLIYFANLRKALSDKSRFSKDKLNIAFEISLSCQYVLPRLYLALLIACTTKNKEQLKLISEMLLAVAHPLRGLLLRFTAISFFPKCPELADLLVDFAVTNFKEMLFLLSGFLKNYPKSKQLACQWLTSNTTISLFLSDNNPNIVKSFFDFAKACKENYVSIAIVDSISQSIEGPQIPKYFDLFADFFKTKAREETAKIKRNKILQAKNPAGAVSSVSQKVSPPQNQQQKISKPQTETSSLQNSTTANPNSNPNNSQVNQVPKTQNLPQNQQQQVRPNMNSNPNPQNVQPHQNQQQTQPQQQQQQPQQQQNFKSQIQINRFQPAAVAMPPMGRVALPPMRAMTSVAMPPISPQQQQQQQKENQQDQKESQQEEQHHEDDSKKENENQNENQEADLDNSTENTNDAESSSDSSNGEEDNEEDENEEQNQPNEVKQETKSADQNETETKNSKENENENEDENTKQQGSIHIMQSLSDSNLVPELKSVNSTTNSSTATTTANAVKPTSNDTNSNAPLQITSSISAPLLLLNQQQPPQQQLKKPAQVPQKRQKQKRRQQQANTLYNATKHIAIACLEKCDNAREGFRFIQMTPFAETCGLEVTRLALRMNDIEVVKMCASRWMKHSVHQEILTKLGYKTFAEILPAEIPGGLEITKEFIQKVTENPEIDSTDSVSLRKILSGELYGRSVELDGYINELIITHNNYDESFYRTLFCEPYKFNDYLQISSVVSRYTTSFIPAAKEENEKEAMKKTVLSFLDRTRIDIQSIISLRCSIYENGENGDDLVSKSLESIQDSILNYTEYGNTGNNLGINNANSSNEVSFESNLSLTNDKTTSSSLITFQTKEQIDEKASTARKILISNLSRLNISDSSLEALFTQLSAFVAGKGFNPKSNENNEFIEFILLAALKGNNVLTEKALLLMINMDLNTTKVSDQIHLYFEAINVIMSVTENENSCLISIDTTQRILEQIVEIIKALEDFKKYFPIMTPVQSNYLLKIADAAKMKKYFSQFESLFDSIIESLKNC